MAYGEDGKDIEDPPRQRRPSPAEREQEKEVDRFDEGMTLQIPNGCVNSNYKHLGLVVV